MSIVVIGSIAFDDVKTDHGSVTDAPGGSAMYFSASASIFAPVRLVGVVGDDFPPEELKFLEQRGVNTRCLEIVEGGKTFRWGGQYEADMNKRSTTNLELNVFENFDPVLDEECRNADYVFLGNIDPELQLRVVDQIKSPRFIGADTIECYIQDKPDIFKEVLKNVNMILINDEEALLLTGKHSIIAAARELLNFGPEYAVVKKGEHGSVLATKDDLFIVPAYPVDNVIDPTGAGDSYAGGIMGYIAQKDTVDAQTVKDAIVYGGIVASFTVEKFGLNRLKTLNISDIEKRLADFRSMTSF